MSFVLMLIRSFFYEIDPFNPGYPVYAM
jgi:hypothetical protein